MRDDEKTCSNCGKTLAEYMIDKEDGNKSKPIKEKEPYPRLFRIFRIIAISCMIPAVIGIIVCVAIGFTTGMGVVVIVILSIIIVISLLVLFPNVLLCCTDCLEKTGEVDY